MRYASAPSSLRPLSPRIRLAVAVAVAVLAAHYAYSLATMFAFHRDMGQLWFAAREVLHGRNPYLGIGPGRAFDWPWPLYYPLPAVIAAVPLALFSEPVALGIFAGLSFGLFTWALGEFGPASLLALVSCTTWYTATLVQLSPLLAASFVIAPLSALLAVKPTTGAALFAGRPSWWALGGFGALTLIAFVVQPGWIGDWLYALNSRDVLPTYHVGHFAIVQLPGGFLVLLSLLRWRRPEARLLAVLACVPQTLLPYEAILLFLIPRGWLESGTLVVMSYVMYMVALRGGPTTFDVRTFTFGHAVVWTMYLPATLMVLRRANEGPIPPALESRIRSWPSWIRGA